MSEIAGDILLGLGFQALEVKRGATTWLKVFDEAVHWTLTLGALTWDKHSVSIVFRVLYHARARDDWGDDPFHFVIHEWDLVRSGLKERGEPLADAWPIKEMRQATAQFSEIAKEQLADFTSREGALRSIHSMLAGNRRRRDLILAAGFLELEMGNTAAARACFSEYLTALPGLAPILGPKLEALVSK